jgi:putative transposase
MKNRHLARAIGQQNFFTFRSQLEYKAAELGIEIKVVDRFYPSSKKCSSCGNVKKDLTLQDRIYKCPVCGLEMDRDENAAKNLEKKAV